MMQTEANEFSASDSLQLIQTMIAKVRTNAAHKSFYFLFWGWTVFGICMLQYVLISVFHSRYHYYAWLLIWVATIISIVYTIREKKAERVLTYVGESIKYLWFAVGINFFVIGWICSTHDWTIAFPIYISLYAVGTFASGLIMKFRPLIIGAMICWLLAIAAAYTSYQTQILLAALGLLASYIIPGHLLRIKYKK